MAVGKTEDDITYKYGRENLRDNPVAKKGIQEYYDRFYAKSDFNYYKENITNRFLKTILKKGHVQKGATILDVGCATGFYTRQFGILGYKAVGVDISSVGIFKGHIKYPSAVLLVGDASVLPLKNSSFDVLFMYGCSLTNTDDLDAIRSFITYLTGFISDDGVLIFIGGSNFSGTTSYPSEWISHSYNDIKKFIDVSEACFEGPYITFLKPLSFVGAISLNKLFSTLCRIFPTRKSRTIIYYIRKKARK